VFVVRRVREVERLAKPLTPLTRPVFDGTTSPKGEVNNLALRLSQRSSGTMN
jgi:hypothetical protein